ncbi:MAG TPA: energy transducer TonB [Rubricoccaceae bacterium]|jgi:protein TonB
MPAVIGQGVLEFSEVSPELVGGLSALWERIVYPEADRLAGTEGTVVIQFVVGIDGRACDPTVVRSLSPGLDRAAFVAIQEAEFTPGRQGGQPVAVRSSLPFQFSLDRPGP